MKLLFVSSRRNRGTGQEREENRPRTVQISVPSELVMDLLAKGAILQVQIGPVPLRPDLARPAPGQKGQNQPIPGQRQRHLTSGLTLQMKVPGQILVAVAGLRLM